MLRWGVTHKLIGSNPIEGLSPLPHDEPKDGRALSADEVATLLDKSPQPWRDIWYAFLVTGVRKEELATLTFADIDWESRELVIRGGIAKNHTARRIPIDNGLWEILRQQEAGRKDRQPVEARNPKFRERTFARFSRDHVFVSSHNTPLTRSEEHTSELQSL